MFKKLFTSLVFALAALTAFSCKDADLSNQVPSTDLSTISAAQQTTSNSATITEHQEGEAEEDHSAFTRVLAENTDLTFHDHTLSGRLHSALIWGESACKDSFALLKMRFKGVTQEVRVEKNEEGKLSGKINFNQKEYQLTLVGLSQTKKELRYTLNDEVITVRILSDTFENAHFQNPQYEFTLNNKTYTFKLDQNEACWSLSAKITMIYILALVGQGGA